MMPRPVLTCPALLCLILAACAADDGYPDLRPTAEMLAPPQLTPEENAPATTRQTAESRADALRARADALRGPVIEPELRQRMQGGRN
ncbi:hypothetical protein [Paracoccus homiensis]|uniref:hypothetical protein n=1 Tax=Paracoccus homiensis TaxID=364199 RepID=UPI00398D2A42